MMKVVFRSKDFVSIEGAGLGFNNRRPMNSAWHYQGRVQHAHWRGTYECRWSNAAFDEKKEPTRASINPMTNELIWTVRGDARLFGLAAALKSKGFVVDVEQD